jgi:outer membrane protein OmpA-like peptidoglycan-associated protein
VPVAIVNRDDQKGIKNKQMKNISGFTVFALVVIILIAGGCNTVKKTNKAQRGAVIGAAAGGVIGGVIGNNVGKGNTVLGAVIGSVVGGVTGVIIGNQMDKQAEKIKNEIPGAEVQRAGEGIIVTFSEKNPDGSDMGVYFDFNKSEITSNSMLAMNKLIRIFTEYPETNILVEGHTDDKGSESYNLSLSERRALAVGDYLKNNGISFSRLAIKWYGESQPKIDNLNDANRAENRRVEFAITANEKMKEDARKASAGK